MNKLTPEEINKIFESFKGRKVLVIGDVMLDSYWWGQVERISPEAPVPIVNVRRREQRLGGAANVALNLKTLGAEPVICSVAGNDMEAEEMRHLLAENGIGAQGLLISENRPTTVKTRVIGNRNQLLRIDSEEDASLSAEEEKAFLSLLTDLIPQYELVLFEDYDKGVITERVINEVIAQARQLNIPVVVDPKKRNFLFYSGASLFKPNLRELAEGLKVDIDGSSPFEEIAAATETLIKKLNLGLTLITLSERGIYVAGREGGQIIPAHIRNVSDVSGAGDTVVSVAALALLTGASAEVIAALSNLAGGIVCEKAGVVPIDKSELLEEALKELC